MKYQLSSRNIKALLISASFLTLVFAVYALKNLPAFDSACDIIIYVSVYLCSIAILVVSFLLLFVKGRPVHSVFLIAGSAIGLLSLLVNTPGSVPDEAAHIDNAYLWSNRLLGISDTISENQTSGVYICYDSYMRKEDANVMCNTVHENTSVQNYNDTLQNFTFFVSSDGAKLDMHIFRDNCTSPVAYFPAILGITFARLLGLGCVPMLYLGKLFMLAFYITGIYWSLKRMPFGSVSLFVISILPMCINIAPSFSYDCVIITFSVMLFAQILYMAYGKVQRIGAKDFCLSAAFVFLLSPLKIMAYFPIVLLIFIIPRWKLRSGKQYYAFCFSMLLIGLVSIFISNASVFLSFDPCNTLTNHFISYDRPAYTAEWILQHPLETGFIIINTTVSKFFSYCIMMIGGSLGWLNIPVAFWIIAGLAVCLMLTCIHEEGTDAVVIRVKHRLLSALSVLLVYLFIVIGMMVWWTPAGSQTVQGIQGRYFIPLLPPILFFLYGFDFIEVKNGFGRAIIMISLILSLCAFSNILISILSR